MLRRFDWLPAGVVFAVFAVMAIHIARTMPVFNPIDELEHFDYAVKFAKGKSPQVSDPLEPEVLALWQGKAEQVAATYMNTVPEQLQILGSSFQVYHPSLFYRLAALLPGMETAQERSVMLLRMLCVAMVIAARVLTWLALRRISPAIGLAGLAYLGVLVPIDALRFSNDAPAMLLGALTFLLFVRHATAQSPTGGALRLAGIALALLGACAMKVTGVLFLIPALALGLACCRRPWASAAREGAVILLPALVYAAVFIGGNVQRDGSFSGTAHLTGPQFAQPRPLAWENIVPRTEIFTYENFLMLQAETRIHGVRNTRTIWYASLLSEVGWVLAWGLACFALAVPLAGTWAGTRAGGLGLSAEGAHFLRWDVLAATLLLLFLMLFTTLMMSGMGRVNWSARQYSVIEGFVALPLAAGWAWALGGAGRAWGLVRIGAWILAACVYFTLTRLYLRF